MNTTTTLRNHWNGNTLGLFILLGYLIGPVFKEMIFPSAPQIEGWAEYGQPVRAGDEIVVEWYLIKHTDCEGMAGRIWAGEGGFYSPEPMQVARLPMGGTVKKYQFPTLIPISAPVGVLKLSIAGFYQCQGMPKSHYEIGPLVLEVVEN